MSEHKAGCDALGGYGNGVGACSCGLIPREDALPVAEVIRRMSPGTSAEPSQFNVNWLRPPGPHGTKLYAAEAQLSTLRDQVARLERELNDTKIASGNAVNGLVVMVERLGLERDAMRADYEGRLKKLCDHGMGLCDQIDALKAASLDVEAAMGLAQVFANAHAMAYYADPELEPDSDEISGRMKLCGIAREALRAALTAKEPK